MKKTKFLFLGILMVLFLFAIPTVSNAYEDTFKTSDGIVVKKVVTSDIGDIEFQISNITLDAEGSYTWSIGKTSTASEAVYSANLGDYTPSKKVAYFSLGTNVREIYDLLRTTNNGYLFIKDEKNNNYIVNGLRVDFTLPPLKAFKVTYHTSETTSWSQMYGGYAITRNGKAYEYANPSDDGFTNGSTSTYGIKTIMYQFVKITDNTLKSKCQDAIVNSTSLEDISGLASLDDAPTSGWKTAEQIYTNINTKIKANNVPTDPGVYYLWLKGSDSDTKTVVGYTIIGVKVDAPIVKEIRVISPASGTYDTTQTVKIRVTFNKKITGTSVPTLKIRFGESDIRNVTNGTIGADYDNKTIVYSYNLQPGDVGQLQLVSFEGGTIKDEEGNDAELSCPILTGNTIKANVPGTINNQTDNKDTTTKNTTSIDPKNLISMPLWIIGGTGTVTLDKSITSYKLYYQTIEVSDSLYNQIISAKDISTYESLLPKYDSSKWSEAKDKKISVDLNSFSGNKNFVVWTKLVTGSDTYYDACAYTVSGNKAGSTSTDTSSNTGTKTTTTTGKSTLDSNNLISLPMWIIGGSGTVTVDKSLTNYKLYYQAVPVSDSVYEEMKKTTDRATYESLIPSHVQGAWTEATNNKIVIDTNSFSGEKPYAIWVKVVSGSNTYYDADVYTISGNKSTGTTTTGSTTTAVPGQTTDTTTANTILPKTGFKVTVIAAIVAIISIGGYSYFKYNKLKEIK